MPLNATNLVPEFDEAVCERVKNYCLLGASNHQIAEFLGISASSFPNYCERFPQLREALRAGRTEADATVAKSLFRRATGYSQPAIRIFRQRVVQSMNCSDSSSETITEYETVTVPYYEHYPPDVSACVFWLKNRHPEMWRDKDNNQPPAEDTVEFTMKIGHADGSTTIDNSTTAEEDVCVPAPLVVQETS